MKTDEAKQRLAGMADDPSRTLKTAVLVALAGLATREVVEAGWRLYHGEHPPRDPSRPEVDWRTALGWTTAVGVGVGLARLFTRRALNRRS